MISIIICSRKADISQELKDNIATTIGCEYELCVIDNSRNDYNIFTAYNEGVRRAKGDILCFMHEDIFFRSDNWGKEIIKIFHSYNDIGAAGVIGGQFLSSIHSVWWNASPFVGRIIQGYTDSQGQYHHDCDDGGKVNVLTDAVLVDGCFICIPASLFESQIHWDDSTYSGFHMYDMDICMQILHQNLRVCITPEILIEHLSLGVKDESYYKALDVFYDKWEKQLPIYRGIMLNEAELAWRTRLLQENLRYLQLRLSKPYRLGKLIIKPFNWIKRFI